MTKKNKFSPFHSDEFFDRGTLNSVMIEMEESRASKEPIITLEGKDANALKRFWNDAPMNNLKDIENANIGAAKLMKDIEQKRSHIFIPKENQSNPTFSQADIVAQQRRLHKTIMDRKESTFKQKNPEPDYAPTGRLDYKDNAFEKILKSNVAVQKRANKLVADQIKINQQQFNLNNAYWEATRNQKILVKERQKVVNDYQAQSEKYSTMGAMAGLDKDIINNMNSMSRRRAQERLDELKEDDF